MRRCGDVVLKSLEIEMIAYLGEIIYKSGKKDFSNKLDDMDIKPRQRTDDVNVDWK